jgi:hypothetical protein
VNLSLEDLARRREALVSRAGAQRAQVKDAVERARGASAAPLLLGAGGVITALVASPKLRGWLVRAWAFWALIRQFR